MFILVKSQMQVREAREKYPNAVFLWKYHARENRILIPLMQKKLAELLGEILQTSVPKAHHEPYWLIRLKVSEISMKQTIQLLRKKEVLEEGEPEEWTDIQAQERLVRRLARKSQR